MAPAFADEPAVTVPPLGATGPVETRPHWVSRTDRAQGRRIAQLRRSSGEERGTARSGAGQLPTFGRDFIAGEMRRILITTGALVCVLVVLTFVLR